MPDYGGMGGGASFRDALMAPAMQSPPATGAPGAAPPLGGPVPLPQQRPNVAMLPPGGVPFPQTLTAAQQLMQQYGQQGLQQGMPPQQFMPPGPPQQQGLPPDLAAGLMQFRGR
jgi:hypothetical protein